MAQAEEVRSNIVLLPDNLPLENVSGWLIWELVILAGFVILSLLTIFHILSVRGVFDRKPKRKKRKRKRKSKRSALFMFKRKKSRGGTSKRRSVKSRAGRKKKPVKGSIGKKRKTATAKPKRKKRGALRSLKMPFLPDPRIIKSYTGKYLGGQKIRANWERVALVGYDSDENQLSFNAYLLTKAFEWLPAKSDAIAYRGKTVNPSKYLKNKALKHAFLKASGLVAVGLVTELSDGKEKDGLARTRAENMIAWLKPVMPKIKVDYLITLDSPKNEWGSVDEEDRSIDEKRAVLWLCLNEIPEEVKMDEALKDALSQAMNLPFDFDIYQEVNLDKVSENQVVV